MPTIDPPDRDWWREFFESPDSFHLAFFPPLPVTDMQVEALDELLRGWAPQRVLDLCCGHGRHLVPLVERGHPMVGLDASELMTRQARRDAGRRGRHALVVRGLAERQPFRDACLDVVLCLFNSFGYLPTDEENGAVLREVARCLRPGGRLLLDTRNRSHQLSYLPLSEIVPLHEGGAVWLTCTHDAAQGRLVSEFRTAGTGKLLYRASIRVYDLGELEAMLARAGLRVEETFGGYDWRPFGGDSRELLVLAKKG